MEDRYNEYQSFRDTVICKVYHQESNKQDICVLIAQFQGRI